MLRLAAIFNKTNPFLKVFERGTGGKLFLKSFPPRSSHSPLRHLVQKLHTAQGGIKCIDLLRGIEGAEACANGASIGSSQRFVCKGSAMVAAANADVILTEILPDLIRCDAVPAE